MTTFSDREKGEEAKYAFDEETRFKIEARRNKLLGLWVAGKVGLSGDAAEAYAKTVVAADFDAPGEEDVFVKVMADIKAKNAAITEAEVRKQMSVLREEARKQIAGK